MTAYAIAHLRPAAPHPDIAEYMERIPATLEPFGGRFLVHATRHEVMEGSWPGHVVMIAFPGSPRHGTGGTRPPTGRSRRCAPGTSTATSS